MPDHERELFADQANTERLLRQIEKRLAHSREIITQIDNVRRGLLGWREKRKAQAVA